VPLLKVDILCRLSPAVVCVVGEVDMSTSGLLQALLDTAPDGDLVLDVAGVRFFSAAGLRVLLRERARREQSGAGLVLVDVSPCVRHVLQLAEAEMLCAPTRAAAFAVLARSRDGSGAADQLYGDGTGCLSAAHGAYRGPDRSSRGG
jgi:anti-anti-sigma factor